AAVAAAAAAAVEDARDKQTVDGGRSNEKKIKHHDFVENSRFCDPYVGFRSFRLAFSAGGQNRCGRDSAGKTKRIRYTATGGRRPCSGGGVFRRACPERDPRARQPRPRQFRRSGRGQKSGGRICCEGEREEFSRPRCEESEPRCSHDWKRRFSFSDSNREAKGQVVLRCKGGPSRNSESAYRCQRTGRDCHLPRFCRSAAGICSGKARRFQGEPVRAATHQHAWET